MFFGRDGTELALNIQSKRISVGREKYIAYVLHCRNIAFTMHFRVCVPVHLCTIFIYSFCHSSLTTSLRRHHLNFYFFGTIQMLYKPIWNFNCIFQSSAILTVWSLGSCICWADGCRLKYCILPQLHPNLVRTFNWSVKAYPFHSAARICVLCNRSALCWSGGIIAVHSMCLKSQTNLVLWLIPLSQIRSQKLLV